MHVPEIHRYTGDLFRAALKKCGSLDDAEDLAQEVLLAALQYPKEIANLKSWLSMVLNHKYCDMLRRKYKLPTVSIDLLPETDGMVYENEAEPDNTPDAESVRREVAYLADKYRTVIVRHYLNGEKVQDIADSLRLPKGTVLSRLSSGREKIRRGFDEMEAYAKHSYAPERLEISCHGCQGFHDEPWALVANDLLKQNILIVAYDKPVTVVEMARSLGMPTAYVENAVKTLVASELMRAVGNAYFTDFMIVTPRDMLRGLDAEIAFVEEQYSSLLDIINDYLKKLRIPAFLTELTDCKRKKLEYYFVLHLLSSALYTATQRIVPSKEEYPLRPDGGKWIASGTKYPLDFDFANYRFGKYSYGGCRGTYWEHFLSASSIDLHVYDTQPDLNKYMHGPVEINDDNLAKLLYILSRGIPFEHTGLNPMYLEDIPHLTACGLLGSRNGKPFVNLPIITPDEYRELDRIRVEQMYLMADRLEPSLRKIFPSLKIDIPKHLEGRIAVFRQYSCYAIPMAFMKKAIERGDFDASDATPPMVFVVDDQNKSIR